MIARVLTAVTIGSFASNVALKAFDMTCDRTLQMISYWGTGEIKSFDELDHVIRKMDIKTRVERVKQLIIDLAGNGLTTYPSVAGCISDIEATLSQIVQVLDDVKRADEYQRKLYFSHWRRFDCNRFITDLCILGVQLETRMKNLTRFVTVLGGPGTVLGGPGTVLGGKEATKQESISLINSNFNYEMGKVLERD